MRYYKGKNLNTKIKSADMNDNTFPDGFPKDPNQAVDFSYFLSDQEKQEWREWIPNANQASQQELVETLHEIWKENQKNAVPEGFSNQGGSQPTPQPAPQQMPQAQAMPPMPTPQGYPAQPAPQAQTTPPTPQMPSPNQNQPMPPMPNFDQRSSSDPFGQPLQQTPPPQPKPPTPPAPKPQPQPTPPPETPKPVSQPVKPATPPTPINVPPAPKEDKPSDNKKGGGQVNEFYFPAQKAGNDQKTTITPPKGEANQKAPKQNNTPQPPKKDNQLDNTRQDRPDLQKKDFRDKTPQPQKNTPEETNLADRQLMKNQLSLLEKVVRSVSRLEKNIEELKTEQNNRPDHTETTHSLNQTAQKIQKDTGTLSSMVNALYDEMSILRTMVQNQQDQIRTLNAHIQKYYTEPNNTETQSQPANQAQTYGSNQAQNYTPQPNQNPFNQQHFQEPQTNPNPLNQNPQPQNNNPYTGSNPFGS